MIGSSNEPLPHTPNPPWLNAAQGHLPHGGPTTGRNVIVGGVCGLAQLPYSYCLLDNRVLLVGGVVDVEREARIMR